MTDQVALPVVPAAADKKPKRKRTPKPKAVADDGVEVKVKSNAKKQKQPRFEFPSDTEVKAIGSLAGYVVSTTGRLPVGATREQLIAWVEKHGGTFSATVTKRVNLVVVGELAAGVSDKLNKAKESGTLVMTLQQLIERCKQPAAPPAPRTDESKTEGKRAKKGKKGKGVGETQVKVPSLKVLLAKDYNKTTTDPKGWWMSEKLDGVRAYWTGTHFLSRQGNQLFAPEFFTRSLPTNVTLDGELYGGRGKFQSTVGIVKRHDEVEEWKKLKFMIFDAPNIEEPFEIRMERLARSFPGTGHPYAELVRQELCEGKEHVARALAAVEAGGGEGVMLRQPKSKYARTRSGTLLKVKSFTDNEAIVVAHEAGKGKYEGKMGKLRVRLATAQGGGVFRLGSGFSDAQREKPPAVGSIITFRHQGTTDSGLPRNPVFVRERPEVDVKLFELPVAAGAQ